MALILMSRGKSISFTDRPLEGNSIETLIRKRIQVINESLEPHERIKEFHILPRYFNIVDGELTASRKLKRKFCLKKFGAVFERMYS